jgi:hypothetical protein
MSNAVAKSEYRRFLADRAVPLDAMLDALSKFGKPRLSHTGAGWYCAVDMYVGEQGVEFKVASEFGLRSPADAVRQCAERMDIALKALA